MVSDNGKESSTSSVSLRMAAARAEWHAGQDRRVLAWNGFNGSPRTPTRARCRFSTQNWMRRVFVGKEPVGRPLSSLQLMALGQTQMRLFPQEAACNLAYSRVQVECDVCRGCSIQVRGTLYSTQCSHVNDPSGVSHDVSALT